MEGERQIIKDIISDTLIILSHVIEQRLLISKKLVMLEMIVHEKLLSDWLVIENPYSRN